MTVEATVAVIHDRDPLIGILQERARRTRDDHTAGALAAVLWLGVGNTEVRARPLGHHGVLGDYAAGVMDAVRWLNRDRSP